MNAVITYNPDAATHRWACEVYHCGGYCFGVAIDAADRGEVIDRITALWDRYRDDDEQHYRGLGAGYQWVVGTGHG